MKIFGKRDRKKRKEPQPEEEEAEAINSIIIQESDEIVLALLREDPSAWNAKQRRLVKRYRDRHHDDTTPTLKRDRAAMTGEAVSVSVKQVDSGDKADQADNKDKEESLSVPESSDDSDDSQRRDSRDHEVKIETGSSRAKKQEPFEARSKHVEVAGSGSDKEADAKDSDNGNSGKGKHEHANDHHADKGDKAQNFAQQTIEHDTSCRVFTIDEDLQAMLDKLNSKQRRKLVRSLERKEMDLETVRSEAKNLLGLDVDEKKATSEEAEPSKKKRKRGSNTDLSQLPAEERLRREEQRRLQKEATEARVDGTMGNNCNKHKHPLNSERRRANRRKPKWELRRPATNEHNSSGFHMRKITSSGS